MTKLTEYYTSCTHKFGLTMPVSPSGEYFIFFTKSGLWKPGTNVGGKSSWEVILKVLMERKSEDTDKTNKTDKTTGLQ